MGGGRLRRIVTDAITVSIRDWPGSEKPPRAPAQFTMKFADSKALLLRELTKLGARDVTLALDIRQGDLTRFGELYADAKPSSSRLLLTFTRSVAGTLRALAFPCWSYLAWQHNMHAIALACGSGAAAGRLPRACVATRSHSIIVNVTTTSSTCGTTPGAIVRWTACSRVKRETVISRQEKNERPC